MEIRSTRSFNAIPATLIRGVFNVYFNLLFKIHCKYFIYLFFYLLFPFLLTIVSFFLFVANLYLLIYLYSKMLTLATAGEFPVTSTGSNMLSSATVAQRYHQILRNSFHFKSNTLCMFKSSLHDCLHSLYCMQTRAYLSESNATECA